jgi:hypothetical protein
MSWMQKDSVRNNPEYFAFHENSLSIRRIKGLLSTRKKEKGGFYQQGLWPPGS